MTKTIITSIALSFALAMSAGGASATGGKKADLAGVPKSVAFLGVHLQNDNEGFQPTSDAERGRMAALEKSFKKKLEASGNYKFVDVAPALQTEIHNGQQVGMCGGCEKEFGKKAGAESVAWIRVQKVSNLILNLNVYIENVADGRMTFEHSVDMRGNDDESWSRSLSYLIENYMPSAASSG